MITNFIIDNASSSSENESRQFYQEQFITYCEDNFPGAAIVNTGIYMQSRVASFVFAQCMIDTNNPEMAHQIGLDVLFLSYKVN